jgi:hypothetical protein
MKVTMMRKLVLVFALSAVVVMTAPVLGARIHAADDNPIAGLKDAKVAFDITAAPSPCVARRSTRRTGGSPWIG